MLAAFTTKDACRRKPNLPPGDRSLQELARLRGVDIEYRLGSAGATPAAQLLAHPLDLNVIRDG